jgi:pimeloyl-ACP methyl ester carboxylesterase
MTPEELVDQQLADATPHTDRIPRVAIEATIAETRERVETGLAQAGQRAQWNAILEIVALLARPAAWRDRLAAITAPTLWLQGEDDPLAAVAAVAALAASRPDWTLRTRAGVGHLPQPEDPVWTVDTIDAWLRDAHR